MDMVSQDCETYNYYTSMEMVSLDANVNYNIFKITLLKSVYIKNTKVNLIILPFFNVVYIIL